MTAQELYDLFYTRNLEVEKAFENWLKNKPTSNYQGPTVDYGEFKTKLFNIIKQDFGLTDTQIAYVYNYLDVLYTQDFSKIYYNLYKTCKFIRNFPFWN